MLARCPPDELGTILEAFGSPAFVVGPSAGGSAPVLAANGRLLAALGSLSLSDLAGSLEREFEQCRSGGATVELDHEIVLPGQTECWHLVLAPLPEGGPTGRVVGRILVTVAGRQRTAPAESPILKA